jgi:thiamine-monophosphate kinase
VKLSELGEFGLIDRISKGCVTAPERVIRGIGDDCAVTEAAEPGDLLGLLTTDMLVEQVHFTREVITPEQLGAKALAVNLSDIAAMGGRPLDAVVAVAIPPDVDVSYLDRLYDGLKRAAGRFGVNILGGDTSRSPADLVISVALTGEVERERILYRGGARPKDRIYVTGCLGDAAAGLDAIDTDRVGTGASAHELARRHLEPEPHLEAGPRIAATGLAHAMIDVSDGLAADLGHICRESGLGCRVERSGLRRSVSAELLQYCRAHQLEPERFVLFGGEDYVLLVAGAPGLERALAGSGTQVVELGQLTEGDELRLVEDDGRSTPLDPTGWDHFTAP